MAVEYPDRPMTIPTATPRAPQQKLLWGVDVFIAWTDSDRNPDVLGEGLARADGDGLTLSMITNRGLKVWPNGAPETFCTDHWRCRFGVADDASLEQERIFQLLSRVGELGYDVIKTEHLYTFDGVPGYSLRQGQ